MRKIVIMIFCILLFNFGYSQDAVTVKKGKTEFTIGGNASDTLTASVTKNHTCFIQSDYKLSYRVFFQETKTSGSPEYSTYLQGSMDGSTWNDIDTITVSTGVDSSYYFTNTTGYDYPYVRLSNVATSTTQKSSIKSWWKFWYLKEY